MISVIPDVLEKTPLAHWIIMAVSASVLILYVFILAQDVKKLSSRFFLIFSFAVFAWGVAFLFFDASQGTPFIHTMVVFAYFVAGFIAPTLYFAIDSFSNGDKSPTFRKVLFVLVPLFLLSLAFLVPGLVVSYQDPIGDAGLGVIKFGKFSIFYVLYSVVLVAHVVGTLIKRYRDSAGIFKLEVRDLLVTFIVTATLALVATLFLPIILGTQNFFWFGYSSGALLFLIVAGFIVIKYNFWSFKIIATEFFISVIILTLLAEIFLARSILDLLVKVGITVLIIFSSFFLVGSVKREIQSKDKIEGLLKALDAINARLKVLDKKKSEFLSIASHHLRDPLTVIKGYASMLSEGSFGEIPTLVREAIEKIFDSSGRLISMISDFMDIARIESGDMNYKFADVDVKEIVQSVAEEMKQNADRAHLSLSVTIDDGEFIAVGDAGKLRQVISNLVDNSIKYTPQGEISLLLSRSSGGEKILFSLSDTGIGMNDITKEKIFRKFSRAEGVSKVYTEGTGLGLYVAMEIIKKHEGRIWAESKGEGQGSSFFVELEAKG